MASELKIYEVVIGGDNGFSYEDYESYEYSYLCTNIDAAKKQVLKMANGWDSYLIIRELVPEGDFYETRETPFYWDTEETETEEEFLKKLK